AGVSRELRGPGDRDSAGLPDGRQLHADPVAVDRDDTPCARDHVAGPDLLTEPHREPADLTGPAPVRDDGPQQSGGQHALAEHRRITRSEERRVGPECRWSVWSQTATQTDGRALGAL